MVEHKVTHSVHTPLFRARPHPYLRPLKSTDGNKKAKTRGKITSCPSPYTDEIKECLPSSSLLQ